MKASLSSLRSCLLKHFKTSISSPLQVTSPHEDTQLTTTTSAAPVTSQEVTNNQHCTTFPSVSLLPLQFVLQQDTSLFNTLLLPEIYVLIAQYMDTQSILFTMGHVCHKWHQYARQFCTEVSLVFNHRYMIHPPRMESNTASQVVRTIRPYYVPSTHQTSEDNTHNCGSKLLFTLCSEPTNNGNFTCSNTSNHNNTAKNTPNGAGLAKCSSLFYMKQRSTTDEQVYLWWSGFLRLVSREFRNLTQLYLVSAQITNEQLSLLAPICPQLLHIKFVRCYHLIDSGFTLLPFQKLQTLSVEWCYMLGDKSIKHVCQCVPNLEQLDISRCFSITNESLKCIAKSLNCLKSLNIAHCSSVTDEGIQALASQRLSHLKRLNLSYCILSDQALNEFTERSAFDLFELNLNFCWTLCHSIPELVQSFSNLQSLSLSGCYMVTEKGFLAISEHLKYLKNLQIAFCDGFTNSCAIHLARMSQLERLDMKMCSSSLNEDIFLQLMQNLINLKYLNLYRNRQVTDAVLFEIGRSLTKLEELILDHCPQLTTEGVQRCAPLGLYRRLKNLSLIGCVYVSQSCKELTLLKEL